MTVAGCKKDQLQGAKAEVQKTSIKLDLPAVPDFVMPQPNPDGTHSVAEMRLRGNKFLDTEVKVKGYVVWIYDCATAIRTPEMSDKDVARMLEDQPEKCIPPHFYIGDKADTPPDRGIWIVDLPRAMRKDDKNLPDEARAEMEGRWKVLPSFKLGDEVVVTGKWTQESERRFRNSDGLLVYKNDCTPAPSVQCQPSMQNLSGPATGSAPPGAPGAPQK
ncbi:MAG TPA: hypothetical protein VK698_34480 [Kofleriaceae bacterium]|nr:hypothetical protein [Kofleriaceae bacterium]